MYNAFSLRIRNVFVVYAAFGVQVAGVPLSDVIALVNTSLQQGALDAIGNITVANILATVTPPLFKAAQGVLANMSWQDPAGPACSAFGLPCMALLASGAPTCCQAVFTSVEYPNASVWAIFQQQVAKTQAALEEAQAQIANITVTKWVSTAQLASTMGTLAVLEVIVLNGSVVAECSQQYISSPVCHRVRTAVNSRLTLRGGIGATGTGVHKMLGVVRVNVRAPTAPPLPTLTRPRTLEPYPAPPSLAKADARVAQATRRRQRTARLMVTDVFCLGCATPALMWSTRPQARIRVPCGSSSIESPGPSSFVCVDFVEASGASVGSVYFGRC